MKKLLFIAVIICIGFQCKHGIIESDMTTTYIYSIVNTLDEELKVSFYGDNQIMDIELISNDTSLSWGFLNFLRADIEFKSFNNSSDSASGYKKFPFFCDSIEVRLNSELLKTFTRKSLIERDTNWKKSIFLLDIPPYSYDTINDKVYYPLDSVNLGLK